MHYKEILFTDEKKINMHHHNLESLKQALIEAVDNFPMDVIRTAIDEWPNRIWRCIRANGGHFE